MTGCPELLELLRSDDNEVLRDAAYRAGESGCEDTVPLLAELLKSSNLGVQEAVDHALRQIGGSVTVRAMVPLLHSEDPPVRNLAMDILRQVGNQDFLSLVEILHDQDPDIRIFATDILGSTDSVLAVAPLCESLLKDPEVNVRYQAAVSLGNLAMPEAAKCLNKAMGDDEWVQFAVVEALTKIRDESSIEVLVKSLDSASDLVASMIVGALGEMGNIKASTMLLKRLDQSPAALRNKIVQAVVRILGGKSLSLLSERDRDRFRDYLLVALRDEEADVQDAAILGLGYMGGEQGAAEILDIAAAMNIDTEPERLQLAIESLARMGLTRSLAAAVRQGGAPQKVRIAVDAVARIGGEEVCRMLMDAFWRLDRDLQREVVLALLRVAGPEAGDFFLDVLARHEDGTVLKGAIKFLGTVIGLGEAGEAMFRFLDHPYNDVKEAALEACIALGGDEMAARFDTLFDDPDPIHRLMAVYAMGKMGRTESLDKLNAALNDDIPDIRKVAVESIAEICAYGEKCLPSAISLLNDEHGAVRLAVVELLGRMQMPEASERLLAALNDEDDWVRIRAMEALAARKESRAVPRLVALLSSDNKLVALKVIESLGAIGGQSAFRALLDATGGDDPELAAAAEEAVSAIRSRDEDR